MIRLIRWLTRTGAHAVDLFLADQPAVPDSAWDPDTRKALAKEDRYALTRW